ncbi:hypothetical protein WN51_06656 [Melipona quadrifasciata]|uniref:Uncharacterized protein n=1 Tax=Melipona quadrifasciata TaxID=166423 RepID=A0A0M9AA71_9HYME|nr:hypothetical protein WN51_06656 [Melipona quadrifasciata]
MTISLVLATVTDRIRDKHPEKAGRTTTYIHRHKRVPRSKRYFEGRSSDCLDSMALGQVRLPSS